MRALLERGWPAPRRRASGKEILKLEPALWAFARHEGGEPTRNASERALRPEVIERKRGFGCHNEVGPRFLESLVSVTRTLFR